MGLPHHCFWNGGRICSISRPGFEGPAMMMNSNPGAGGDSGHAPRILEIGPHRLMREGYPDTTDHWSTLQTPVTDLEPKHEQMVTLASLPQLRRALASENYDLVVVHPGTFRPWHLQALTRSLFRRSALGGGIPYFRNFGQEMIRGRVTAPIAIWDAEEMPAIYRHQLFLLDRAALYFKRELPPDHWRVFMATVVRHRRTRRTRRWDCRWSGWRRFADG